MEFIFILAFGVVMTFAGRTSFITAGGYLIVSAFVTRLGYIYGLLPMPSGMTRVNNSNMMFITAAALLVFIGLIVHHLNRGWISPKT